MLCLKCQSNNGTGSRFCNSCGAILPRNVALGDAIGRLDLQEGKAYGPPDRSYPNVQIDNLEQAIYEYLEGHGSEEDVFEIAEELEESAAEVLDSIPRAVAAASLDQQGRDDELLDQLPYMLGTGAEILNAALTDLDHFLSGEPLEVEPILARLRESNDYLCYSAHIIQTLFEEGARSSTLDPALAL